MLLAVEVEAKEEGEGEAEEEEDGWWAAAAGEEVQLWILQGQ